MGLTATRGRRCATRARRALGRSVQPPWPVVLLVLLLVLAAAVVFHETRGTTLLADDWKWALYRRGNTIGTFLEPHNEHLSLIPLVIYRLLFGLFGIKDYAPYRVLVIVGHLTCAVLVFVYTAHRVGQVLGLCAAGLVLFLGPGWQNFMWPFQIAWLISLAAGVAALLMLDRRDRAGDLTACLLTAVALASSGVGLAIAIGVVVELAFARRRLRDAWIAGLPLALYGVWWLKYQQSTPTSPLHTLPSFVADSAASALSALVGLAGTAKESPTLLHWGRPLAIVAVVLLAWRLLRLRRIPPRVLTLLVMLFSFWVITGLGRGFLGPSSAFPSRYLYVSGMLIVLIACELAAEVSIAAAPTLLIACVTAAAVAANIGIIDEAGASLRRIGSFTRADLGALEIGRTTVSPGFRPAPELFFGSVIAAPYFAAERAYGTPADSPAQLVQEPDDARVSADRVLMMIHGIGLGPGVANRIRQLVPTVGSAGAHEMGGGRSCLSLDAKPGKATLGAVLVVTLPPRGLYIRAQSGPAAVWLRRFAQAFQPARYLPSGRAATVQIGPDLARTPWRIRVVTGGRASVCALGS